MDNIMFILIKPSLWILFTFLIYQLLLRRERWFQFNRFYLLFSLLMTFVVPFIHIGLKASSAIVNEFAFTNEMWQEIGQLEPVIRKETVQHISLYNILVSIYIIGVILCIIRVVIHLFKLGQLIQKHQKVPMERLKIIPMRQSAAPFSFFHYIFIDQSKGNAGDINQVVKHEKVHAQQFHSLDLIVVEMVLAFQWFNPFIYWLRKALKEVHEYLADAQVVKSGVNKIDYQKLLLRQIQGEFQPVLASGFNYSLIKKRITMISKIKTKRIAYSKLFIVLPLLMTGMLLLCTSNSAVLAQNASSNKNKTRGNIPCIMPVDKDKAKITSEYGMRMHPIYKVEKFHKGVDFAAPVGTPVKSTANGTIRKVETNYEEGKGYGMYIIIDHADGYSTFYTQLSGYTVKEGDKVKCGDLIGYVGESGINTGSHLHYEVKKDGENVNPADYY